MPHTRKVKKKSYSDDLLMSAVKAVLIDPMKMSQVAKDYSVPRKTLVDYVKQSKVDNDNILCQRKRVGHQTTIFTNN